MQPRDVVPPIVNLDAIELQPRATAFAAPGDAAQRFDARMGEVGSRIGARKLGYNITAVPPGKRAFPKHNHRVNEELFFILEGTGEVRIGDATYPLRAGDFLACPPGGPETAHQIINTGAKELKYLAISTMEYPEICEYPDSGKFLVAEGRRRRDGTVPGFRFVGRWASMVDYWDGE
jgi:uncharacterized cupin superfamily protein